MMDGTRLYERAGAAVAELSPLWHMGDAQAVFAGPLGHNASHRHSVPVYVVGIYDRFRLRIEQGEWLTCRTAVVPAGVAYEFDVGGHPIGVCYVEPTIAGVNALTPLVHDAREEHGALIGSAGEVSLVRELWEDGSSADWAELALNDLLRFSRRRSPQEIDGRITRVVRHMYAHYADLASVAQVAGKTGLSASRFQHLFTQEVGVPFRRFRAWCRMRAAIREILSGSNFTQAAHAAGFADQPHFARDFRRTFGAPASRGLLKVRRRTA